MVENENDSDYQKLLDQEQALNEELDKFESSSGSEEQRSRLVAKIDKFIEHAEHIASGVSSFRRYRYISSLITSWSALRKAFVPASVGAGATSGGSAQGSAEIVDFPSSRGRDPLVNRRSKLRKLLYQDENDQNTFNLCFIYTQYFDRTFGKHKQFPDPLFQDFINSCASYLTKRLNGEGMRVTPHRIKFDPDDPIEYNQSLEDLLDRLFQFEILVPEPATWTEQRQDAPLTREFIHIGDFTSLRAVMSQKARKAVLGPHFTPSNPPTVKAIIDSARNGAYLVLRSNTAITDYVKTLLQHYDHKERPRVEVAGSNDQIRWFLYGESQNEGNQSAIALLDNGVYFGIEHELPKGFGGYRINLDQSLPAGYFYPLDDGDFEFMIRNAIHEAFVERDDNGNYYWNGNFREKLKDMGVELGDVPSPPPPGARSGRTKDSSGNNTSAKRTVS